MKTCLAILISIAFALPSGAGESQKLVSKIQSAAPGVVLAEGTKADPAVIRVERSWDGAVGTWTVRNSGTKGVRIARVDLCDIEHGLPGETPFYGESFQMLAQNGGTLAKPQDWGSYPDRKHYKLEEPEGLRTAHGMLLLRPQGEEQVLIGFGSCRRFDGRISFSAQRLLVSLDMEGLELGPGQTWALEEVFVKAGLDRSALLDGLCERIERHHPKRSGFRAPPMGWCSWYCFGPRVTVSNILSNLDWIATNAPQLRYIQIDDGYQPWMGDWLETGKSFGGDIKDILHKIRARGFEPAIWVAPFVASPESKLFRDHPEWFVKDDAGAPLRSDKVGFGGWRLGPWYVLDGTHPGAQQYMEHVFRTMRQEWGCTYFKLDANYWGALHHGRFHDRGASRIEAYRRGMQAVLRGTGDAFVLGCNHPIWPSLGLIDGSRSSMDISRNWGSIRDIGRQNLLRGWQNGRFWWNDPDCVLLSAGVVLDLSGKAAGKAASTGQEYLFHAATIHASGGMLLSGDDLPKLKPDAVEVLRKLIPPTGRAASFADETLAVGRTRAGEVEYLYLFNWSDQPADRAVSLAGKDELTDFWSGERLGEHEGEFRVSTMPPHSARLIVARPVK